MSDLELLDDEELVVLPNDWRPRPHQRWLWDYWVEHNGTRGAAVWHRRAGKDSVAINGTAVKTQQRVGTYWHMLPEARQGRKVIWDAIDRDGRRIIDQAFPESMRVSTDKTEMQIKLANGSVWQVVGSDNYNSLVGANPIGVVLSEYSISNPAAWDYLRPILRENGGWAIFIYTPRGANHGKKLFLMAQKQEDWFAELLTVDDTHLVTPEQIQKERDEGMDDDLVDQEYFCSWTGSTKGAIFGEQMRRVRDQGRICKLNYVRSAPVNTFWDIGHGDKTTILFHQKVGPQHRIIRAFGDNGLDMVECVKVLKDQPYLYGKHYLPHDAKNVTLAAKSNPLGANVYEQLVSLGVSPKDIEIVPRTPDVWTSIKELRTKFDELWFDETECENLINALSLYRKEWSDERQCFADKPYHDWTSDWADALRQWSQGWEEGAGLKSFTAPAVGRKPLAGRGITTIGNRRVGY